MQRDSLPACLLCTMVAEVVAESETETETELEVMSQGLFFIEKEKKRIGDVDRKKDHFILPILLTLPYLSE